ncbi:MAG TPA: response regulator transcription factor [Acidimicrobiia bacterium]|jgi:DNA-binding response OmpR family regulator
MEILLVEDDDSIAEPLTAGLRRDGFEVARVRTASQALAHEAPEFVLLDLGLPDADGSDVCRELRSRGETPIIVITARADEIDRVVLLELGADDYLVKPFGFRELRARIRAVMRRTQPRSEVPASSKIGDLEIDRRTRRVTKQDEELQLTPKEFDLLAYLASDPGAVFARQDILEAVWDTHWYGPTKTLDVHIAALRKKLGDPAWIATVRGVGFRLHEPE